MDFRGLQVGVEEAHILMAFAAAEFEDFGIIPYKGDTYAKSVGSYVEG